MPFRPTIGLEIHAELSTRTKMFCACRNDPDEARPNANVCPVCLAHPGTLPVPNKEAVRHVLRVGLAAGGTLADFSEFDRKSYFYPDMPKGYQISQYEHPLISGGELAGVQLTRIHLEEDTARSSHRGSDDADAVSRSSHRGNASLIDFNRAGVPLMELVTEPVIRDAATAGRFARELQLLLRTLGASHANLEKGEMRIEANISVSEDDSFGTKVEVKNLNSFRSVERAIEHEVERQSALIAAGERVLQETRGWDEAGGKTFPQRLKEGSADYRYFPEPDIPKLVLSELPEFSVASLLASLPELPSKKRERLAALGVRASDIETLFNDDYDFMRAILETVLETERDPEMVRLSANYLVTDVAALAKERNANGDPAHISPGSFLKLMRMIASGEVSSRGAKDVLARMYESGEDPADIANREGLMQISDPAVLQAIVDSVLQEHAGVAADYRGGKEASLMFLLGAAMKASKGAGNPNALRQLLVASLQR